MFRRTDAAAARPRVRFEFEGQAIEAREGDSLAAALLAAGIDRFRVTPTSGRPRGPYCMMGACFECLVEVDGAPNRQACMVRVTPGMRVRCQDGAPAVGGDHDI